MRISFLILVLAIATHFSNLSAQSLVGKWTCPPAGDQAFQQETLNLGADGNYTVLWDYGYDNTDYDVGRYEIINKKLIFHSTKADNRSEYEIESFAGNTFTLYSPLLKLRWNFTFQENVGFSEAEISTLQSWSNYRDVDGEWNFDEGKLKFLAAHGLVFIYYDNQQYWGTYSFNGNHLTITEISAEKNTMYSGMIHFNSEKQFQLVDDSNKEATAYNFAKKVELNEQEITLVSEYLTTMHRINMSIIGSMGGDRLVWKKVDKYGNIIE